MSSRQEAETALLEQVLKLPRVAEQQMPEDYLDANGHVNMMYYTLIANLGWRVLFDELGLPREHFVARQRSTFTVRQFISYFNELREGDRVGVHAGLVSFDDKRIYFVFYIVNLTTHRLASSDERLIIYMDMQTRRAAVFEPENLARLEQVQASHAALGWQPVLSGAIETRPHS